MFSGCIDTRIHHNLFITLLLVFYSLLLDSMPISVLVIQSMLQSKNDQNGAQP